MRTWIYAALLCAVLVLGQKASGQTINWHNQPWLAIWGSYNLDSSGSPWDATYTASMGVFDTGFDPSLEDPADWLANWTVLSASEYNTWANYFAGAFYISNNTYAHREAYLWIHNDDTSATGIEWALVKSSSWVVPEKTNDHPLPEDWSLSQVDEVVYGEIYWRHTAYGEYDLGETPWIRTERFGEFNDYPQLANFPAAIPEPTSTTLLLSIAAATYLRRRRRS